METEWNGRRLEGKKCLDIYTNIFVLLEKNNIVCSSCFFSFVWPGLVWFRCLRNQAAVVVGGAKKIAWEGLIAGIFRFSISLSLSLTVFLPPPLVLGVMIEYNNGRCHVIFYFQGFQRKWGRNTDKNLVNIRLYPKQANLLSQEHK